MLSHRRRTFDAKPQWLANGIEHGSVVDQETMVKAVFGGQFMP
jgi:hypothetical protein